MRGPLLDYKKLDFSRSNIAPWLSLPKDLWSLILKDFQTWRKMRVVCKYFAKLIDPIFCMRIIINDGHVMKCKEPCGWFESEHYFYLQKYSCTHCRKMYTYNFKSSFNINVLKRKWKWCEDYRSHFWDIKKQEKKDYKKWFRFEILESKQKIPQVQKYFEITQPYDKVKLRTKDEYDPNRKSNHKKFKYRKTDRRFIDRVNCAVDCTCCDECLADKVRFY